MYPSPWSMVDCCAESRRDLHVRSQLLQLQAGSADRHNGHGSHRGAGASVEAASVSQ